MASRASSPGWCRPLQNGAGEPLSWRVDPRGCPPPSPTQGKPPTPGSQGWGSNAKAKAVLKAEAPSAIGSAQEPSLGGRGPPAHPTALGRGPPRVPNASPNSSCLSSQVPSQNSGCLTGKGPPWTELSTTKGPSPGDSGPRSPLQNGEPDPLLGYARKSGPGRRAFKFT